MRAILLSLSCCLLTVSAAYSQELKKDNRAQQLREDRRNELHSGEMTQLDLLQALSFMGVRIHKFKLPEFDQEYLIRVVADEYYGGTLVKTDTLLTADAMYHYWEAGKTEYFLDYIDQVKVFTQDRDDESYIQFNLYNTEVRKPLKYRKVNENSNYTWRTYEKQKIELSKKTPLLLLGSSWPDHLYGFERFCGVAVLNENDLRTQELFDNSPHYFIISLQLDKEGL